MNNGVARRASGQGNIGIRGAAGFDKVGARGFPPGFPTWNADALRDAWTRQANGGDPVTILVEGDSVTEGTSSSDWTFRWTEVMRAYLRAATGIENGTGLVPAHMSRRGFSSDSRWTYTTKAAWSDAGNGGFRGGTTWNGNGGSAAAADLTFEPQTPVDGFTLWWVQNALSNGTWEAKIDGVSVGGPYATTQGNGIYSQTFRASSRGLHTFTYSALAASTRAYILGVEGFVDSQGGVKVITDGVWGSLMTVGWETAGFGGTLVYTNSKQVAASKVDAQIWAFGLNHRIQNQTLASFRTLFDTLATYQANASYRPNSIILMVPPPPQAGGTPNGAGLVWDQYAAVIRESAARYNWGLIDVTAAWGTYANKTANYTDDVHPTDAGYAEMGRLAADVVLSAIGVTRPSTPATLRSKGLGYLMLFGSTQYAQTADSAALDITGEIDLAIRCDLTDWTKTGGQVLFTKWGSSTADRSYELSINVNGVPQFMHYSGGSNRTAASAAGIGLTNNTGPFWIRCRRTVDGVTRFYTATDSVGLPASWTQLGGDVAGTAASLQSGSASLLIGLGSGSGSGFTSLAGKVYRAQVWSGDSQAGGTLAFDARFDLQTAESVTFAESSSNAATVNIIGTSI